MYHKRSKKHMLSWLLAVMMVLQLCVPAYAEVSFVFNFKAVNGTTKQLKAVQNPDTEPLTLNNYNASILPGSDVVLTAIPDDVYHVVYWKFDNVRKTEFDQLSQIKITNVQDNLNVEVVLEEGSAPEYTYKDNASGVSIVQYNQHDTDVVIPSRLAGKPVTEIAPRAFYVNGSIGSVTIPDTVTKIGEEAFSGCGRLDKVTFKGTSIEFGKGCFDGIVWGAQAYVPAGFNYPMNSGTLSYPFSVNTSSRKLVLAPNLDVTLLQGHKFYSTCATIAGTSENLRIVIGYSDYVKKNYAIGAEVPQDTEKIKSIPYTVGTDIELPEGFPTVSIIEVKDGKIVARAIKMVSEEDVNLTLPFETGDGSEASPYQIKTAEQLSYIGLVPTKDEDENEDEVTVNHFKLMNDIDLAVSPYNTAQGWKPINFEGHLDGNGKTLKNLTINRPEEDGVGLFARLSETAEVKNLAIVDANVTGKQHVGILAGMLEKNAHIEQVYATGNVSGVMSVGGLVGSYILAPSTIVDCYARANVIADSGAAGGLVGSMMGSTIKNSYAVGKVTIKNPTTIENPDTGELINVGSMKGGLVGYDASRQEYEWTKNTFVANYYDAEVSGLSDANGATGKTTAQMKAKETFLTGTAQDAWDFNTVWGIDSTFNDGYPYLRQFKPAPQPNKEQAAPTGLTAIHPTTVANNDGKISGINDAMEYRLDIASDYTAVTGTQITGLVPATYKVRYKAKDGYNAGADATVIVPSFTQPQNQEQVAPVGLVGISPTTAANNDGKITGVENTMEYKVSTGSSYITITSNPITGLAPATYYVRYKAKEGYNAGVDTVVVVGNYIAPTPTPSSDDDSSNTGSNSGSSTGSGTTPTPTPTKPTTQETKPAVNDNAQPPTAPIRDTASTSSISTDFTDVSLDHWAKASIEFVRERGLFSGTGEGGFSPDQSMSRGMFVTVLGRLSKIAQESYKSTSFTDVSVGSYYLPYIEWASEQGIVSGTAEATFAPDQDITREQMAVLIVNYAKVIGFKLPQVATENTFADNDNISAYAKAAVAQMQRAGIFSGRDGNRFAPKATASRAEVSAVFERLIKLIEKK
jgi:hypothetical protein